MSQDITKLDQLPTFESYRRPHKVRTARRFQATDPGRIGRKRG